MTAHVSDLPVVSRPLPLALIDEDTNTRKRYDPVQDAELTESIRGSGVRQPVHVRPAEGGRFKLVAGYRRRRCALAAGLADIPAIVQDLSDAQAREWNLVENLQRTNPHPVEEADAFRELQEQFGYSAQVIAAKMGKDVAYIYKRLQLCALGPAAREAFLAGRLYEKVAFLLATIPDAKLQAEAVRSLTQGRDPVGYNAAREYVERSYRLRLRGAPFSLSDTTLLPSVPSCNACPKRTGNSPMLFDDASAKDLCTDSSCYSAKSAAGWTKRCESFLAKGHEVLDEEESAKLFRHGSYLSFDAPFVDLADVCVQDAEKRTWGAILGPAKPGVVLARDCDGRPRQLIRREEAAALLGQLLPTAAQAGADATSPRQAAREKRAETARQRRTVTLALEALAEAGASRGPTEDVLRFLAVQSFAGAHFDTRRAIAKRRGVPGKGHEAEAAMAAHISTMTTAELVGFLVELQATRWAFATYMSNKPLHAACELLAVDLAALSERVTEEDAQAQRARAEKRSGGTKKRGTPPAAPAEVPSIEGEPEDGELEQAA